MHLPSTTALRQSIARIEGAPRAAARFVALGHAAADRVLGGGLKRAALHEVFAATEVDGMAASGFVGGLARRTIDEHALLWIRQDLPAAEWGELFGPGLAELGFDPNRLVVVKVGQPQEALKAAWEALACAALGAVLVESWGGAATFDLTASRRLALAAERSGVTAIMLRFGALPQPSAAETRWVVKAAQSQGGSADRLGLPIFDAELVRSRKGLTGRWMMEWNSDAYRFRAPKAPPRIVDAPASHRPDQTPAAVKPIRKTG